jgi:hypothetical protein
MEATDLEPHRFLIEELFQPHRGTRCQRVTGRDAGDYVLLGRRAGKDTSSVDSFSSS